MSIKEKYKVKSIAKHLCKEWLLHKHYAKRIPSISFAFGLFNKELVGVMTMVNLHLIRFVWVCVVKKILNMFMS